MSHLKFKKHKIHWIECKVKAVFLTGESGSEGIFKEYFPTGKKQRIKSIFAKDRRMTGKSCHARLFHTGIMGDCSISISKSFPHLLLGQVEEVSNEFQEGKSSSSED